MKYLCLIYSDHKIWEAMPKAEIDQLMAEFGEFASSISESGHYLGAHKLQPTHAATTVRVRDGHLSTTDGPFAETKEQLGGYYLIDVPSLDEAVAWAGKMPHGPTSRVEIRPVMVFK
ncbi:MAG: YciI family protein [Candidatus Eisenbacteria bacterium]|uniref:YciI family protein n=1 Tax=Eiseniibacteriota bacterium TaxID=2212470 RepID=A0A956RSB1_UNCEI|nr:YciI family protein [Candidatus Eisenbacteria bacterium]